MESDREAVRFIADTYRKASRDRRAEGGLGNQFGRVKVAGKRDFVVPMGAEQSAERIKRKNPGPDTLVRREYRQIPTSFV